MKIKNKKEKFVLEIKRFYFPSKITWTCDRCNEENIMDFDEDYLSYPPVNEVFDLDLYCPNCDNEHVVKAKLSMKMDIEK